MRQNIERRGLTRWLRLVPLLAFLIVSCGGGGSGGGCGRGGGGGGTGPGGGGNMNPPMSPSQGTGS